MGVQTTDGNGKLSNFLCIIPHRSTNIHPKSPNVKLGTGNVSFRVDSLLARGQ